MAQRFSLQPRAFESAGYEVLSVGSEPITFQELPDKATHAIIAIEAANVRWLLGADPSATLGIPQLAGDYLEWLDPALDYHDIMADLRWVSNGTASVTIQYLCYSLRDRA